MRSDGEIVEQGTGKSWGRAVAECRYFGETVTWATAKARCDAKAVPGDYQNMPPWHTQVKAAAGAIGGCGYDRSYTWLDAPCDVTVQVRPGGALSIVHAPSTDPSFQLDARTPFRVRWEGGRYPTAPACDGCAAHGDTCVCNVTATSAPAFHYVPSRDEADAMLTIGSPPPDTFDAGTYTHCAECEHSPQLLTYLGPSGVLDGETIFTIVRNGSRTVHLRNLRADVVVGEGGAHRFRNPPHFVSFVTEGEAAARDAAYETDAALDHYVHHQNTPPFVAYRLIQRLVTSNPSPRYVEAVATAFATGAYTPPDGGAPYGDGAYGDLGAAAAAVLLDREARSATLDADPSHGGLREPLLKLLHALRALEYRSPEAREVELHDLQSKLGQQAYNQPSVFNFYLPEYEPLGPVADSGLVSPEAQILTTPTLVSWFNGATALVRDGLQSCYSGFGGPGSGDTFNNRYCGHWKNGLDRRRASSDGNLTFAPSGGGGAAVVSELSLLLTGGRLNARSSALIEWVYDEVAACPPTRVIGTARSSAGMAGRQARRTRCGWRSS